MPSEDETVGRWITKVEGEHHCKLPEVGDHYDRQFGYESVWKCSCNKEWIFLQFVGYWGEEGWEPFEHFMKRKKDSEAYRLKQAEESRTKSVAATPTPKKRWWSRG